MLSMQTTATDQRTIDRLHAIDDATSFAQGAPFRNDAEARAYFSASNQCSMHGDDAITDEHELAAMADLVITHLAHYA
jgi:hypothetical protein